MNELQIYLKVRGITTAQLARELGWKMHRVQKTVKCQRHNAAVRHAIASHLGLDPRRTWTRRGVGASYLATQTERAAKDAAVEEAQRRLARIRAEADCAQGAA